jgi:anthranilate synthase component 1
MEPVARGPYGGGFGFVGYNGDVDLGITIRTAFGVGDELYIQAGAGIVAESVPEREYNEVLAKCQALFTAFGLGGRF